MSDTYSPLRSCTRNLIFGKIGVKGWRVGGKQPFLAEMIAAARSSAFHYKKRSTSQAKPTTTKKASSKNVSPSPSQLTIQSANSLSVPNLRKRSGSVPALKITTLATEWNMKHTHIRALRMTWARLCEPPRSNCKGIVNLVERVWDKLDNKDSTVRNIFYHAAFVDSMHDRCERRSSKTSIATMRDHTHFFVSLVSQVVQNLDNDPTSILEHIDQIGRNHSYLRQYGFKSTHWEKVGEYFIDIVVIQDCVRAFPDACRAWTLLVAAIVDRLRAAPRRTSLSPAVSTVMLHHRSSISINCPMSNNTSTEDIAESVFNRTRRLSHCASASELFNAEQEGMKEACPKRLPKVPSANTCLDVPPLTNTFNHLAIA